MGQRSSFPWSEPAYGLGARKWLQAMRAFWRLPSGAYLLQGKAQRLPDQARVTLPGGRLLEECSPYHLVGVSGEIERTFPGPRIERRPDGLHVAQIFVVLEDRLCEFVWEGKENVAVLRSVALSSLSACDLEQLFKEPTPIYCEKLRFLGLTCDRKSLRLRQILDDGLDEQYREWLYCCTVCGGLYKYIYSAIWQERNFDCERGLHVTCDRYFKVEERYGNSIPLPVEEAALHGYQGAQMVLGAYSASRCSEPSFQGMTCSTREVLHLGYCAAHHVSKCRCCGEFYKQVWLGFRYRHFKPGEVYEGGIPFTLDEAISLGYRTPGA